MKRFTEFKSAVTGMIAFCEKMTERLTTERKKLQESIGKKKKFEINSKSFLTKRILSVKEVKQYCDAIQNGMKTSLSTVKFDKLSTLPVPTTPCLNNVFKSLFIILYQAETAKYDWNDFKKEALLKNKGQDFQARMASFDFNKATE